MPHGKRRFIILLLIAVAVLSVIVGMLISRQGGERGRQLRETVVSGQPVSLSQQACPGGCVFVPLIARNAGRRAQASSNQQTNAIDVAAQVSPTCDGTVRGPVAGARVTVIAEAGTRVGVTGADGHALFEATSQAATVQIEWPAGYFPCPNSRPAAEFPTGAGRVVFTATSPGYP